MRTILFAAIFGTAVLASRPSFAEPTDHGAILPLGAHEVGRGRYQSASPYAETLKFYSKVYSVDHFPRRLIADVPGVRGIHLSNAGHGAWEGLNIYELNGVTRIFVVTRDTKGNRS